MRIRVTLARRATGVLQVRAVFQTGDASSASKTPAPSGTG